MSNLVCETSGALQSPSRPAAVACRRQVVEAQHTATAAPSERASKTVGGGSREREPLLCAGFRPSGLGVQCLRRGRHWPDHSQLCGSDFGTTAGRSLDVMQTRMGQPRRRRPAVSVDLTRPAGNLSLLGTILHQSLSPQRYDRDTDTDAGAGAGAGEDEDIHSRHKTWQSVSVRAAR